VCWCFNPSWDSTWPLIQAHWLSGLFSVSTLLEILPHRVDDNEYVYSTVFQPFLRFYQSGQPIHCLCSQYIRFNPSWDSTREFAEKNGIPLEIEVSTLLEILRPGEYVELVIDREYEFQPFLRFYTGPSPSPRPPRRPTQVSTLLEILH